MAPFEVRCEDGQPYAHPFLVGLNVPRPQLTDIDSDGDLDLFVQEVSGRVMFFENVSSGAAPEFVWRTDRYQDLDVGEWYRFFDMDSDGDSDLLTERPFSYVTYYRNDGTSGAPAFTLVADSLRDVDGVALFSDRQNIPNLTDIDCDGRPDLFLGQLTGTVKRYEAESAGEAGIPSFRLVTDRFEDIEIVAQELGSRHGANTMALTDIDLDGDQDLFWGDFFEAGLLFIENRGTCSSPSLRGEPVPFPTEAPLETSGYNAPTFGDVDGDGDVDLVVGVLGGAFNPNRTSSDNLYFYERLGDEQFELRTRRFVSMIDVGSESIPSLVDLDGDGDLDMLVANKIDPGALGTARIYYFENEGTPVAPSLRRTGTWDLEGQYHYAPTFGDLDGDGDLDMLMGSWRNRVALHRNQGSAAEPDFVAEDTAFVTLTRGGNTTPALVDIDADGDLDLFVGEGSGTINYYRNTGTALAPAFELISDNYDGIDVGRRSFPVFEDLDGDGDLDMVVGRDAGVPAFYRNTGTPEEPVFEIDDSFAPDLDGLSTPAFADIDGDGDRDLFSGGTGGGVMFFENRRVNR